METVVVSISAKPGMEDRVIEFYLGQQSEYEGAPGFISRTILKAKSGLMLDAIRGRMSAEEMEKHPAPPSDEEQGVDFILIERWESVDARMDFTMNRNKSRDKDLFPYLLPRHSAEFFEDLTA